MRLRAIRAESIALARAVRRALLRRAAEGRDAPNDERGGVQEDNFTFDQSAGYDSVDKCMTHKDVNDIVFNRLAGKTDRDTCSDHEINAMKLRSIRRWTIWRYMQHRLELWQKSCVWQIHCGCFACP